MGFNPLFILWNYSEWGSERSIAYPWRATDYISELFDELAGAGDDFVGLLLQGVPGKIQIGRKRQRHLVNYAKNRRSSFLMISYLFIQTITLYFLVNNVKWMHLKMEKKDFMDALWMDNFAIEVVSWYWCRYPLQYPKFDFWFNCMQ